MEVGSTLIIEPLPFPGYGDPASFECRDGAFFIKDGCVEGVYEGGPGFAPDVCRACLGGVEAEGEGALSGDFLGGVIGWKDGEGEVVCHCDGGGGYI